MMDTKENNQSNANGGQFETNLVDVGASGQSDFQEFNKTSFLKNCQTSGKNQTQCNENISKLIAECERLNGIAKKKSAILAIKNSEMEKMNLDKKKSAENANSRENQQIYALQQDLKSKEVEIKYLESQLKKKEEENAKLKKETEKMLLEQQIKFSQSIVSQTPTKEKRRGGNANLPHDDPEKSPEYL